MDDIAAEAGVGKGTLYRRFGDKGGLAFALLDERERGFQERMVYGEAPLGPGAPATERLVAFVGGYVHLVIANGKAVAHQRLRPGIAHLPHRTARSVIFQRGRRHVVVAGFGGEVGVVCDVLG